VTTAANASSTVTSRPQGACAPPVCRAPFASGVCPEGSWCAPSYARCFPTGSAKVGEPCGEALCEEGAVCADGRCARLCRVPDDGACLGEETCLPLPQFEGVGLCARECVAGAEASCPSGSYCFPADYSRLGVDFCRATPDAWPSDAGFGPFEACPSSLSKLTHTFTGASVDCKNDTSSPEGGPDRGDFYVGIVKENAEGDTLILTVRFTELTSAPAPGTYTVGAGLRVTASFDSSSADAWTQNYPSGTVTVTGTAPAIRVTLDPSLAPLSGFMACD